MIEIHKLTKFLHAGGHRVDILNGIDLSIPKGQWVSVTGASGSGKTTLLSLIAGLDTPSSGQILIDGEDITQLDEDALAVLRGQRFGFVFQNFHLIPTLTALENVLLSVELNSNGTTANAASDILAEVGLKDRLHHYPSQLSGGEQQRLSLARAYVNRPDIILADEPTGNLDSRNSGLVMELMTRMHRENQATVILVTHEPQIAEQAERTLVMEDGRIIEDRINPPAGSS